MTDLAAQSAQQLADTEITAKVKAKFLVELGLQSMKIGVDTVNGVVTLTGTVDTKARNDQAKAQASAISGVREVVNQLVVSSSNN